MTIRISFDLSPFTIILLVFPEFYHRDLTPPITDPSVTPPHPGTTVGSSPQVSYLFSSLTSVSTTKVILTVLKEFYTFIYVLNLLNVALRVRRSPVDRETTPHVSVRTLDTI